MDQRKIETPIPKMAILRTEVLFSGSFWTYTEFVLFRLCEFNKFKRGLGLMNTRKMLLPLVMGGTLLVSDAFADCQAEDSAFNPAQSTILRNKGIDADSPGGENWKEDHCRLGQLFKVGDGSSVDPRTQVGTWGAERGGIVRYNYSDPGSPYRWRLFSTGANQLDNTNGIDLCWENIDTGEVIAIGTLQDLSGLCP